MSRIDKGFTLIELMIVIAIVGIISAIATARFAIAKGRSKQSEATTCLKAMFTGEKAFFAEKGHFSVLVEEIGFSPERNNRYAYFAGNGATMAVRSRPDGTEVTSPTDVGVEYDAFKYGRAAPSPFLPALNVLVAAPPCTGALGNPGVFIDSLTGGPAWSGQAQGQIDNDPMYDLWTISTVNRIAAAGAVCDSPSAENAAGVPLVETNDILR